MRFVLLALLLVCACDHSHSHSNYSTYSDCFTQHSVNEGLTTVQAIVVCCLDHDIGGQSEVCGADAAACMTYLDTALTATQASGTDKMDACAEYVRQKGM